MKLTVLYIVKIIILLEISPEIQTQNPNICESISCGLNSDFYSLLLHFMFSSVEIKFWPSVQVYYTGAGRDTKMHNTNVSSGPLHPQPLSAQSLFYCTSLAYCTVSFRVSMPQATVSSSGSLYLKPLRQSQTHFDLYCSIYLYSINFIQYQ